MVIVPPTDNRTPDHSNTPAGATAIELSESFQGRIDSADDVDYFRLRVDSPGTLTIRTTGTADPDIAVFDGAGEEVQRVSGSWIGRITQEILDRGSDVFVRFSGGNAGGEYTGNATLDQTPQTSPDLVVGSPTVSDSSPETGGAFTLSATVSNQGDGESAATTLRYFRSTEATITTSDTEVGTDAVAGLAASGSDSRTVDMAAPSAPGTYHYGACVDAVTGESNTANNCSTSVQVTVREPEHPDLTVVSPTVSDNSPAPGASFTLSATVRNDGNGESAATTLRYYRSADGTITRSDTEVGTDAVAGLAASVSDSRTVDMAAPSAPGTYHYGACVDAVAGESNTANNCSTSVQVTVREPDHPDLTVVSPTVSDNRPAPGASFTLSATVQNDGNGESAATTLRYFRSTDATITMSDKSVGTDAVSGLAASVSDSRTVDMAAPSAPGTYYYGACVDAVAGESNTANNCSTAVQIKVVLTARQIQRSPDLQIQRFPDLVVGTPTASDPSPEPGASFTLSATVSNTGGAASPSTTLRYYRSTDATITMADKEVGTDAVAGLAASGSDRQSVDMAAPSAPGTYHYGACVDAVVGESNTANNCSTAVEITVLLTARQIQRSPDLEVGTPTVSDPSPEPGASFTLSATVSNTGGAASPSTTLRFYRSVDISITSEDTEVGTAALSGLAASGSGSGSVSLTAPSGPGIYYYGACVDAVTGESDTVNNCSLSVPVTVPSFSPGSDLAVGSPTASVGETVVGASFTLSATVINLGDQASPSTTLQFYRSYDVIISPSGWRLDTAAVPSLAAEGTSSWSVSAPAPSRPGTWYYGACVIPVDGESDKWNNCSPSVKVTVLRKADLVVGSPTASPGSPPPGTAFTLSATVRNTGRGAAPSTTLRYYRSTDATITRSDTPVGTAAVPALAAEGTSSQSISLTAPSALDIYYYGACVDAVTDESDTENNCSSVRVTVLPADLVVGSPTASAYRTGRGASFTLSVTVRSTGGGALPSTTLRYYRSKDRTITTSDTLLATGAVGALGAAGTSKESISLTTPLTFGTYHYGACVDTVAGESDTENNCSSSVGVTAVSLGPDRVVDSPTVSPSNPVAGTIYTFSVTLRNTGDRESGATKIRYYRLTSEPWDQMVGGQPVGALDPGGARRVSISLFALSRPGTYHYRACVDAGPGEFDSTNNCSSYVKVTVLPRVDLVVGSPTVSARSPVAGTAFTLSATVGNTGNGASASTMLRYYRSTDATITTSDTSEGTDAVGALAPAGTSSQSISVTAPSSPGIYYYGACVDTVANEPDTTNNCSPSVRVTVLSSSSGPDLVVGSPTVSAGRPVVGASFTLSATVINLGRGASVSTTLRYYRSTDATITTSDTSVGTATTVGALAAAGTSRQSSSVTAPASAGVWYYGACVATVTGESGTTNNCSSSVRVTVLLKSDLVVSLPTVSPSNPSRGNPFDFLPPVRNTGAGPSPSTKMGYYRSTDATITTSDTWVGGRYVRALDPEGVSRLTVSLYPPTRGGTYYYGACVDAVAGESNTTNNCSLSVEVTVR